MKKNDYSYKNLYKDLKQDSKSSNFKQQILVENKMQRLTKQINQAPLNNYNYIKGGESKRQLKQFHSTKQKQNDSRSINRIQTQTAYQSLKQNPKSKKQFKIYNFTQEDEKNQLRQKVDRLEEELKKKIIDHGFMNYFKTTNSSSTLNHLDIYLELISFQEAISNKEKLIRDQQKKLCECHKQIEQLLVIKQEQEQKLMSHTQQIRNFNEIIDRLKQRYDRKKEQQNYYEKYVQIKTLSDEIQKQRNNLVKKNKQLEQKLSINEISNNMQINGMKQKYEIQMNNKYEQLRRIQDQIQKYNLRLQQYELQHKQYIMNENEYKNSIQKYNEQLKQLREQRTINKQQIIRIKNQYQTIINNYKYQFNNNAQQIKNKNKIIHQYLDKINHYKQKINQYQQTINQSKNKQKKYHQKINQLHDQLKRTTNQKTISQSLYQKQIQQLKSQLQSINIIKSQKQHQYQILFHQKTNTLNQLAKQQNQLIKNQKIIQKYQHQNTAYQNKLQTLNDKKLSNQRFKILGKIKQIASKIRSIFPQPPQIPNIKQYSDQVQKGLIQLNLIVNILINDYLAATKAELEQQKININTLELQKQYMKDAKQVQLELKQEAIKILIKFIPEDCLKSVQQYMILIQDIISNCTNQSLQKKINLIQTITKYSEKIKQKSKEQTQFKKNTNLPNLNQTKIDASIRKPKIDKSTKKDMIKKYFQ